MALPNITTKIINSDDYNERKILASDVNQIKQAIQTGVLDIKPSDIHMEGNVITADGGQNWIRRSGNKFQYYDAGTWKEITESTNTATFTAGEDISIRDVVYLNTADGKIYKASSTNYDWIGVAKEAITNASTGEVYLNNSVIGGFTGLTPGAWYGLNDTPGAIVSNPRDVGIALSATQIILIKNNYRENNLMTYAILYNRMENDAQATAPQLNANIQSDLFCCAAGKYSTVCTAGTTSTFSTNLYTNCIVTNHCYTMGAFTNYSCKTCVGGCSLNWQCCIATIEPNYAYTRAFVNRCNCNVSATACTGCISSCGNYLNDINCYSKVCVTLCTCIMSTRVTTNNDATYTNLICFNGITMTYSCSNTFICCLTCNIPIVFNWNGTNYDYCCCGTCLCTVNGTTCYPITVSSYTRSQASVASGNCLDACNFVGLIITKHNTQNKMIVGNIKTYAAVKNQAILTTHSTLPAGNCVRYNIKNQAGTVLLCDASPDAVYSLSSPANCLYAEIYQCVKCNLCTPQCMTQYALMYM